MIAKLAGGVRVLYVLAIRRVSIMCATLRLGD